MQWSLGVALLWPALLWQVIRERLRGPGTQVCVGSSPVPEGGGKVLRAGPPQYQQLTSELNLQL